MTQPRSAPLNESEDPEAVSLRFRFDSETVEQFAERYASDVSRGGIFVHSRQPFAVGTQLRLDLQLLNGTPLIVGEGTVFWTREPDPGKPATVPGMGIRFSKLSGRSQQVIELVLSQRTGRQRTGLFSTLSATVSLEESQKILNPSVAPNPKSKLPFNVFPGSRPNDSRPSLNGELLANAGREETTPVVGVTAANLADARPGKDEPASKTPPPAPAAPIAEIGSAAAASGGSRRQPPALALIRPDASPTGDNRTSDAATRPPPSGPHRSSSVIAPIPSTTSTQEIGPTSGSTPPAPAQGEPALGASGPIQSVRPPKRTKLIIGAAALLAVTITVFATTRKGSVTPGDANPGAVARVTAISGSSTASNTNPDRPSVAGVPSSSGTAPTETAPEANAASTPAPEPEMSAPAASGSSKSSPSSRTPDRRAPKGKAVVAHRANESQPAAHTTAPAERPPVAETTAPHVEAPAPTPPAPVAVRAEPPPAPKVVPTAPPPIASIAHKLRMTSIPSEAEVELDGKSIGRTPLFGVEIDISRPHALVVKKDGYAPFKQTISNGSDWNVRASENTATLRVSALMKKVGAP